MGVQGKIEGTVLVVDDDKDYCDEITSFLERYHIHVIQAHTPAEAERRLEEDDISMVLLDVMLPDKHGFVFCEEIRAKYESIPILMVSAYCDNFEQVLGFEAGADYFLSKPFLPQELLARMKAIQRRMKVADDGPKVQDRILRTAQGLEIDVAGGTAMLNGTDLKLTSFQFELLTYFVQNSQRLITREEIMTKIHFYNVGVLSRSVDINVSRLRRALGDSTDSPQFIRTIWRKGYFFVDSPV